LLLRHNGVEQGQKANPRLENTIALTGSQQ
jgi:hypothetical protein